MAPTEARRIRNHLDLTQYAGFPVYFFDFALLSNNISSLAGWTTDKLETVIGARADNLLARADVRVPVESGFYIIFSCHEPAIAQERANAICTDILKHFFGTESLIPEGAHGFCRPTNLQAVAVELGLDAPRGVPEAAEPERAWPKRTSADGKADVSLMEQMNALFRSHFGESKHEPHRFLFAPVWDAAAERVVSFLCQPAQSHPARAQGADTSTGEALAAQAATDTAALAFALKGVWHVVSRGDIALVSVPVHIETLSWSKHRNAYLNELAHIEPKLLGLLAFHIHGLTMGSSLSQLSQGVSVVRRHARRIFVHLPSVSLDFSHAGLIGATGFGVSAPSHQPRIGEGPLDGLAAVATRLKRICAAQNALAYMDNVQTGSAAALLKSQGIRLMAGPVFDAPSEEPGTVGPLPLSDILAADGKGRAVVML